MKRVPHPFRALRQGGDFDFVLKPLNFVNPVSPNQAAKRRQNTAHGASRG